MQENKSLVQEALIQMKQVEEAIAENAKGILASTMKEEINQLVKESLSEQADEDEVEAEVDIDVEDEESDDMETDNEDEMEMDDMELDMDMDSEESPIDLTDASDEDILRVFKAMGEDDGIIVKKDGEDIHLKDNEADTEYLVKMGESVDDLNKEQNMEEMYHEVDEASTEDVINAIFSKDGNLDEMGGQEDDLEEMVYEIEFEDSDEEESEMDSEDSDEEEFELEMMEDSDDDDDDQMMESDDDDDDQMMESDDDDDDQMMESDDDDDDQEDSLDEAYNHKKAKKNSVKGEKKSNGPKFSYEKTKGGFNEKMKEGPKSVGTGSAKKVKFGKGENAEVGKNKMVKKVETKESGRYLGAGSKFRKGGLPKPRAHSKFNINISENLQEEVSLLREKNEEYRKALNVFRDKLNEVAIFNSNLAYATRLFTEHSTTKKEKINILRRFDSVESLKESKNLYKSIKEELSKSETKSINETVENKINKQVSSGSATTLIESKTYENPQFLRMKDLMSKIR